MNATQQAIMQEAAERTITLYLGQQGTIGNEEADRIIGVHLAKAALKVQEFTRVHRTVLTIVGGSCGALLGFISPVLGLAGALVCGGLGYLFAVLGTNPDYKVQQLIRIAAQDLTVTQQRMAAMGLL